MSNINSTIILSLVTLIIIILFLNLSENFTNMLSNKNEEDNQNFTSDDVTDHEPVETLPDELKMEVENLVDEILEGLNANYNKKLIRINIDRVQKTFEENKNRFNVWVYVFNYKKESTAKLLLEFTLDCNNFVSVLAVQVLGSRQNLISTPGGVSARDSLNLKKPVDMDKVDGIIHAPLEYTLFNVAETSNKNVDRNAWILNKEAKTVDNVETYPARKITNEWDINGVHFVEKASKNTPNGINYGNKYLNFVPNFYKNNFEICTGDYLWLFEKERDVASKPLGVG